MVTFPKSRSSLRGATASFDRPAESEFRRRRETAKPGGRPVVFTVGHSTRALDDFIALLTAHGVQRLVDVRTVPRSRHNPQFNRDTLPRALHAAGIGYVHMAGLGGLRKARPDSVNAAWRNLSFRGYADHMQSAEFRESLDELIATASKERLALMCAEAVPWRCHRSLIGDALLVHDVRVEEIVDAKRRDPHKLTPFAVVDATNITYPPAAGTSLRQGELFPAASGVPSATRAGKKRRAKAAARSEKEPT
jgi:hypothetical protein